METRHTYALFPYRYMSISALFQHKNQHHGRQRRMDGKNIPQIRMKGRGNQQSEPYAQQGRGHEPFVFFQAQAFQEAEQQHIDIQSTAVIFIEMGSVKGQKAGKKMGSFPMQLAFPDDTDSVFKYISVP